MDGFFNMLKPPGMTSHDMVAVVRKELGQEGKIKVGHTGTLDPAAAGVLPLCVGKATRMADFLLAGKKSYRGEITLGITTDTLDAAGEVKSKKEAEDIRTEDILEILALYDGIEMMQTPPAFSAVRFQGKRFYELAREKKEIPVKEREISVYKMKLLDFFPGKYPRVFFEIECSGGTYVRSLAAEIGGETGAGGHLSFLLRTNASGFSIEETITIEEFTDAFKRGDLQSLLYPVDYPVKHLPIVKVIDQALRYLVSGNYLYQKQLIMPDGKTELTYDVFTPGQDLRIYDFRDNFRGLGRWQKHPQSDCLLKPYKILYQDQGEL